MIDLDKAEALLRAEGLIPVTTGWLTASIATAPIRVRIGVTYEDAVVDQSNFLSRDWLTTDEADAHAGALTSAAALCRRIEAECQVTP